jgi:hypothetical protein
MRADPALARLFSGSHFYSTTPMPNWRVQECAERAYESTDTLQIPSQVGSMLLFNVVKKKGIP